MDIVHTSIINISGSFLIALISLGCADLSVAKNAYKNANYDVAKENFQELNKRGFPSAQKALDDINYKLALLELKSNSSNGYTHKALLKLAKLSNKGYAPATYKMAVFYENINQKIALEYFNLALNQGHQKAQKRIYKIESKIVKEKLNTELRIAKISYENQDFDKASKIYLKHAKMGNIGAIYKLSTIFYQQQKIEQAIKWHKLLIHEDYPDAWHRLSLMLKNKNPKQSLQLLKNASNAGYAKAQLDYGQFIFTHGNKYEGLKLVFIAVQKKETTAIDISINMISQIKNLDDVNRAYLAAKKSM